MLKCFAEPELDSTARAVVEATVSAVSPDQVILFGSRARGDAQEDSDIDLLVIMPEPFTAARSRQGQLRRTRRALHGCQWISCSIAGMRWIPGPILAIMSLADHCAREWPSMQDLRHARLMLKMAEMDL